MRPCKGAVASLRRPESATESLKVTALTALDFGLDGLDLLSTGLLLCCQRGEILRRKKQLDIFIIFYLLSVTQAALVAAFAATSLPSPTALLESAGLDSGYFDYFGVQSLSGLFRGFAAE